MTHRAVRGLMVIGVSGCLGVAIAANAAEYGGTAAAPTAKEHGGTTQEHGGTTQEHGGQAIEAAPSSEQIRQTIKNYVQGVSQQKGVFPIKDSVTGTARQLEFVRVHDRVGKTGALYYSCTDMRDTQTGELLDLDFDVQATGEQLKVVDQRIHKVAGQARYTYDEHDNRVPVISKD